ncbi:hypothetical protein AVEN_257697-1 [Araneus ventricosus]|uniref:ATP-dependent DNA helicase n=1 Tax=Araneus ventricosus TaxID=182803 RepID=A0A4Y2LIG0_ARAVE|nr:hypothetical protein AVEN_257697-1 [Araneus ventricosus]
MSDRWRHPSYHVGFDKHVDTLSASQQAFAYLLDEWIRHPQQMVVIVAGGPGSGKTYTVTSCLNRVSIPQLRMAPTARVAQRIGGSTIHSALRLKWSKGSVLFQLEKELEHETNPDVCIEKSAVLLSEFNCYDAPDIVVIDEIGISSFWFVHWIIQYFFGKERPMLFIVMGDPNQLRPVKASDNVFGIPLHFKIQRIDLHESKRFTADYMPIIEQLRKYVDRNDETGCLTFICNHFPIVEEITSDILKKCTRALAYLNSTVETYNNFYLKRLVKGEKIRLKREPFDNITYVDVKPGCFIFVTQNSSTVKNGTPLKFLRHVPDNNGDYIECKYVDNDSAVKVYRNRKGDFPIVVEIRKVIFPL